MYIKENFSVIVEALFDTIVHKTIGYIIWMSPLKKGENLIKPDIELVKKC